MCDVKLRPVSAAADLMEALRKQRKSNTTACDVIFVIGGLNIYAHRGILGIKSTKWRDELSLRKEELRVTIDLSNKVDREAFEAVLDFLYCLPLSVSMDNVASFVAISDMFGIQEVKDYCQQFLQGNLSLSTAVLVWFWSKKFNMLMLERLSFNVIQARFADWIISNGKGCQWSMDCLQELLSLQIVKDCEPLLVARFIRDSLLTLSNPLFSKEQQQEHLLNVVGINRANNLAVFQMLETSEMEVEIIPVANDLPELPIARTESPRKSSDDLQAAMKPSEAAGSYASKETGRSEATSSMETGAGTNTPSAMQTKEKPTDLSKCTTTATSAVVDVAGCQPSFDALILIAYYKHHDKCQGKKLHNGRTKHPVALVYDIEKQIWLESPESHSAMNFDSHFSEFLSSFSRFYITSKRTPKHNYEKIFCDEQNFYVHIDDNQKQTGTTLNQHRLSDGTSQEITLTEDLNFVGRASHVISSGIAYSSFYTLFVGKGQLQLHMRGVDQSPDTSNALIQISSAVVHCCKKSIEIKAASTVAIGNVIYALCSGVEEGVKATRKSLASLQPASFCAVDICTSEIVKLPLPGYGFACLNNVDSPPQISLSNGIVYFTHGSGFSVFTLETRTWSPVATLPDPMLHAAEACSCFQSKPQDYLPHVPGTNPWCSMDNHSCDLLCPSLVSSAQLTLCGASAFCFVPLVAHVTLLLRFPLDAATNGTTAPVCWSLQPAPPSQALCSVHSVRAPGLLRLRYVTAKYHDVLSDTYMHYVNCSPVGTGASKWD